MNGLAAHVLLRCERVDGVDSSCTGRREYGTQTIDVVGARTNNLRDCPGVGGRWQAQEDLIITHPDLPLFEGASPWYAKWRSGGALFVPALAEKRGVNLGRP